MRSKFHPAGTWKDTPYSAVAKVRRGRFGMLWVVRASVKPLMSPALPAFACAWQIGTKPG